MTNKKRGRPPVGPQPEGESPILAVRVGSVMKSWAAARGGGKWVREVLLRARAEEMELDSGAWSWLVGEDAVYIDGVGVIRGLERVSPGAVRELRHTVGAERLRARVQLVNILTVMCARLGLVFEVQGEEELAYPEAEPVCSREGGTR